MSETSDGRISSKSDASEESAIGDITVSGATATAAGSGSDSISTNASKSTTKLTASATLSTTETAFPFYTRKEVQQLCSNSTKMVLIIQNKVYNIEYFINNHPGGRTILMTFIGRDASSAFDDVGHSKASQKLLQALQCGIVVAEDQV